LVDEIDTNANRIHCFGILIDIQESPAIQTQSVIATELRSRLVFPAERIKKATSF